MNDVAPRFVTRGWCPTALRPMESGDGLIVRLPPTAARLSRAEMQGIAAAAQRHGNGHIDVTRRANLQIRGVRPETVDALLCDLRAFGLLGTGATAMHHILLSPLAGLDASEIVDMRPLAGALAVRLALCPPIPELTAKFSIVLDGGGLFPLAQKRADIRALACAVGSTPMIAIACGRGEWLGITEPEHVVDSICEIIAGKSPKLQAVETLSVQMENNQVTCGDILPLGEGRHVVGVGVPFGRLEAHQLRVLSEIAPEIRLSPWRMLYIPTLSRARAEHVLAAMSETGLARANDVRMRIQACPGYPGCAAGHTHTRADAEKVAQWMAVQGFGGTAHLSGCAKGCASSSSTDITLVGVAGGYRLMLGAAARDAGGIFVKPSDIPARLSAVVQGNGHG